jgi:hypothetical protein
MIFPVTGGKFGAEADDKIEQISRAERKNLIAFKCPVAGYLRRLVERRLAFPRARFVRAKRARLVSSETFILIPTNRIGINAAHCKWTRGLCQGAAEKKIHKFLQEVL